MGNSARVDSVESRFQRCRETLESRGQEHVLRWWGELDGRQREHLLSEIESVRWSELDPLIETHVRNKPHVQTPTDLKPAPVWARVPNADQAALYREAAELGQKLIRSGKVAAFTVAGGQGMRLGFDGPKGAFPITPVRRKTLFQLFAETILAVGTRYDVEIRWYIMTSPANHEQTVTFFREHDFFGLGAETVWLFEQGMLPIFGLDGRVLLTDKHKLALGPDGHGGSLKALAAGGALRDMQSRGVEIISYFQVDNPLIKLFDPLFIGLHAQNQSDMSTKVTRKVDDFERVGNVCLQDDRVVVIEYSNFPEHLARARDSDGSRKFDAGNLAMHLLGVEFVDSIAGQHLELPYHRAEKAVPCLNDDGLPVQPEGSNAVKLETFVFDALPLAEHTLVLEIDRAEEFSPVKNARGVDSVESGSRDQIRRAARWLEAAGVTVPRTANGEPDATIEIAPSYALDAEDVKAQAALPASVHRGEQLYLRG